MRAWFLNLDADDELADPSARTPSATVRARTAALSVRLAGLVPSGDLVVADPPPAHVAAGREGRAFCPTPRARAALVRAGARLPPAPDVAVLRRVNHRRFSADLGRALPGARWVEGRAALDGALADPSPTGLWLLRRPFGFAGRGRLRFDPSRRDAATERWIDASLRSAEGLEVAPWVQRTADFGLHGHLAPDGDLVLGEPTTMRCDESGAWLGSERAGADDLAPGERAALRVAAEEAAAALVAAGYFGPYGVDAFRWVDGHGARRFEPRCEVNARYSMGWAVGMGDRRPDLVEAGAT